MKAKQKVKNFGREEVGISNLIATLVLIVAAIVGGAFVFMTMRDQATTMASNPDASIQSINVTKAQGTALATVTVKNSGSKPLKSVTVTIYPETATDNEQLGISVPAGNLAPGETISADKSLTTGSYVKGEQYTVRLHAVATDDSTISKTLKVRVK